MATNGNERQQIEQLENTLRGVDPLAVVPPGAKKSAHHDEIVQQEHYDLSTRMLEAAAACRDIAHYSNDFADHLEKAATNYLAGMQRLLGRVGRK